MTDFNLGEKVKAVEALLAEIQEQVPAFPFVFGYLTPPPRADDVNFMMSGTETQQIAICERLKSVPVGNFLDRLAKDRQEQKRIKLATPADVPRIPRKS